MDLPGSTERARRLCMVDVHSGTYPTLKGPRRTLTLNGNRFSARYVSAVRSLDARVLPGRDVLSAARTTKSESPWARGPLWIRTNRDCPGDSTFFTFRAPVGRGVSQRAADRRARQHASALLKVSQKAYNFPGGISSRNPEPYVPHTAPRINSISGRRGRLPGPPCWSGGGCCCRARPDPSCR